MRRQTVSLIGSLVLLAAVATGSTAIAVSSRTHAKAQGTPAARIGAIYFDGWACPLTNFHFKGLLGSKFAGRRPLSGWRDNTPQAMQAQLRWAHSDGIAFFLFDWYREDIDPCLNVAHDNYLKLHNHEGVGLALLYVNHDPFGVSPAEWPALVERWVTRDFLQPDYLRIGGKPLLVILDTTLFRQQQGGTAGVNAALATLQNAAHQHGLPGVFVVGGRYTDYLNADCFPGCVGTDGGPTGLAQEGYDGLTEYAYTGVLAPIDGPRPYSDVVTAKELNWEQFAQKSPVPYIPSIMDGWDPRPWDERPYGHLFWFVRTPAEVGGFLRDAIAWVDAHPTMRVEPAPAPPLVLVEAWNELGEGGYLPPTDVDGYRYGQAVAGALGVAWAPPPRHRLTVRLAGRGSVRSSPAGIHCPPRCRAGFAEGRRITLTAVPKRSFTLSRWIGACRGSQPTCSFILLRGLAVRAVFRRRGQ